MNENLYLAKLVASVVCIPFQSLPLTLAVGSL